MRYTEENKKNERLRQISLSLGRIGKALSVMVCMFGVFLILPECFPVSLKPVVIRMEPLNRIILVPVLRLFPSCIGARI